MISIEYVINMQTSIQYFYVIAKIAAFFLKEAVGDYIQRSLFSRPVEPFYGLWLLSSRRKYVYDTPMRTAKKKDRKASLEDVNFKAARKIGSIKYLSYFGYTK